MLGSDKSRGYCLEMMCVPISWLERISTVLNCCLRPSYIISTFSALNSRPGSWPKWRMQQHERENRNDQLRPGRLQHDEYDKRAILQRDGWRCQFCGAMTSLECIISSSEAVQVRT